MTALRLLALGFLSVGLALVVTVAGIALYEEPSDPTGHAIIVLSGDGSGAGVIEGATLERVERGVALYLDGASPLMVMTGHTTMEGVGEAADLMRDVAISMGVPPDAVLSEPRAASTLQNALFSAELAPVDRTLPTIIVTHRFHLPRSRASFWWAGYEQVVPVAATPAAPPDLRSVLWEGIKWPVNVVRATGASVAWAVGVDDAAVQPWLR